MRKPLLIVFIFLCSNIAKSQDLKAIADSICKKNNIPAMAFSILTSDYILEKEVVGFKKNDSENDSTKVSNTDYFHLGSNTKAITSLIAAYLVEKKKIKWTTPFFELFPKWQKNSNIDFKNITLEDLLSHRANVPAYTSGAVFAILPKFKGNTSEKRKSFCEYILKNKSLKPNEAVFNYSNAGYSIAGLMLEKVSRKSWEELVKIVLKDELKLNYKMGWPNRFDINQPWGHWIENNLLTPVAPNTNYNLNLAEPAGDISMSIDDYSKLIQLILKGYLGDESFLKNTTFDYLLFGKEKYAMGWGNFISEKQKIAEHAGSDGTFFSYTQIDIKTQKAYIILINSATQEAQKGVFDFLKIMRKKNYN